jgi:hypothetical protein
MSSNLTVQPSPVGDCASKPRVAVADPDSSRKKRIICQRFPSLDA